MTSSPNAPPTAHPSDAHPLDARRTAALRDALLDVVDLLRRRRAAQIPSRDIDDYVALGWLQWKGGGLALTESGQALCKQLVEALHAGEQDEPDGPGRP